MCRGAAARKGVMMKATLALVNSNMGMIDLPQAVQFLS